LSQVSTGGLRDRSPSLITTRSVEQFYDPVKQMFLPDRYIKGECPKCGTKDQYGDACEYCGSSTRRPISESVFDRVRRDAGAQDVGHFFFRLSDPRASIPARVDAGARPLQPEVANKALEWLAATRAGGKGLADWDISRDAPYFGIPIPDAPGKYFYVWLDAPSAISRASRRTCAKQAIDSRSSCRVPTSSSIHFIGKDISIFPHAVLAGDAEVRRQRRTESPIASTHGFITFSGEKMSKSRGTGISPDVYLDLGPQARVAALLPRRQAEREGRRPRFQSGRLHRARQQRSRRQIREQSHSTCGDVRHPPFDGKLATPSESENDRA
jgi:methionyl-tRNA synthetase